MLHRNCVLHGVLQQVPWDRFDARVAAHGADKRVRSLPTRTQFIALVFAQLCGLGGLRETVTALNGHAPRLYHLGARPVARSTLADANRLRPAAMFAALMRQAGRGVRRDLECATYPIGSTALRLNEHSADRARFSAQVCGAKVHVIQDPEAERPIHAAFSTADVNDITAAQAMPIQRGATKGHEPGQPNRNKRIGSAARTPRTNQESGMTWRLERLF